MTLLRCGISIPGDSPLQTGEGAGELMEVGLAWSRELYQRAPDNPSGNCDPVAGGIWSSKTSWEVKDVGVEWGQCPSSLCCLVLKEDWGEHFLSFSSSLAVKITAYQRTVGTAYCSMEKYEMLLPDKPSYKCWKPVQREQRRLLFSSQWVEPRERREAPSGWSLESLLGKKCKAPKKKNKLQDEV